VADLGNVCEPDTGPLAARPDKLRISVGVTAEPTCTHQPPAQSGIWSHMKVMSCAKCCLSYLVVKVEKMLSKTQAGIAVLRTTSCLCAPNSYFGLIASACNGHERHSCVNKQNAGMSFSL
jgi:hypothetical protein